MTIPEIISMKFSFHKNEIRSNNNSLCVKGAVNCAQHDHLERFATLVHAGGAKLAQKEGDLGQAQNISDETASTGHQSDWEADENAKILYHEILNYWVSSDRAEDTCMAVSISAPLMQLGTTLHRRAAYRTDSMSPSKAPALEPASVDTSLVGKVSSSFQLNGFDASKNEGMNSFSVSEMNILSASAREVRGNQNQTGSSRASIHQDFQTATMAVPLPAKSGPDVNYLGNAIIDSISMTSRETESANILQQIKVASGGGGLRSIRIQLKPENLGSVDLNLRLCAGGLLIEMSAETSESHRLLEMNADSVTEWLRHKGCNVVELRMTGTGYNYNQASPEPFPKPDSFLSQQFSGDTEAENPFKEDSSSRMHNENELTRTEVSSLHSDSTTHVSTRTIYI